MAYVLKCIGYTLIAVLLIGALHFLNIVGFCRVEVRVDEPLDHPHEVVKVEGGSYTFDHGVTLQVEGDVNEYWEPRLSIGSQVELVHAGDKLWMMQARRRSTICGNEFPPYLICLPFSRKIIYRNRKMAFAIAHEIANGAERVN